MRTSPTRTPRSALLTAVLAAVVTVAALVVVVVLRPKPDGVPGVPPVSLEPAAPTTATCGSGACRQLAAMTVGATPVVLLSDASGGWGRVRVGPQPGTEFELAITTMGAKLNAQSLRCIAAETSACLVTGDVGGGDGAGGAYGELLIGSDGVWRDFGKPYFADAGTLSLFDVNTDGRPDVIVVRHECPDATPGTPKCQAAPVLAEVYQLSGKELGCTRTVVSPSDLRGWPQVEVRASELRPCADGG
ncbi:hypothetical protein QRX50_02840 [Amycolatopsis carbonis]|uniref:Uncharacterized protein n=1 Tax=Amycolatopsis carbonis TaxID=715471 RepID=A0A9Y2IIG8_9PSEU|nr:hypothetical protein [Amycolatopsis sp. 2-15]WIX79755.1 hypothetical protein QRX50_02840 [Amycolatopsis sp. 2-15]